MPNTYTVTFQPSGISIPVEEDQSLQDVALAQGIIIPVSCENGICQICEANCYQVQSLNVVVIKSLNAVGKYLSHQIRYYYASFIHCLI